MSIGKDKNGTQLKVGDLVTVPCQVRSLNGLDKDEIILATIDPGETYITGLLQSQVVRVDRVEDEGSH